MFHLTSDPTLLIDRVGVVVLANEAWLNDALPLLGLGDMPVGQFLFLDLFRMPCTADTEAFASSQAAQIAVWDNGNVSDFSFTVSVDDVPQLVHVSLTRVAFKGKDCLMAVFECSLMER